MTVVTGSDRPSALRITTDIPSIAVGILRLGQLARFSPVVGRSSSKERLMIKPNSLETGARVY
jgi:hypothetical protein